MTVKKVVKEEINHGNDWFDEKEIEVTRDGNKSFGISIVGGTVNVSDNTMVSGIFIKNIMPNSSAEQCRLLNIGDRILAVDGINIRNFTHEQAMTTMKNAGSKILLRVQSIIKNNDDFSQISIPKKMIPPPITPCKTPDRELIHDGNSSTFIDEIQNDENDTKISIKNKKDFCIATPPLPTTESENSSDEEDTQNMEGKTFTKAGVEIDRASAGNVRRSKEESAIDTEQEDCFGYTTCKLKKKYGSMGQVFMHVIIRKDNGYLGISLAGHRDRTKMACFIAGINPKGMASSTPLEIGDEIVEVNGIVLQGRSHLNVPTILKSIIGTSLKFVIIRRKPSADDLAVKPVTQFPLCLDEDEDVFAHYTNVRMVQIKKGNSGLGIMIIEGKHAEVGQGIFISDIQEGSMADMAGLHIGEMILAVNKDSLIGCSYETAASLLKKSDGVVVLKICNPNKTKETSTNSITSTSITVKGSSDAKACSASPDKATQSSRPVTPMPKKSPAKEVVDPSKALIVPNENTTIEIDTNNKPLGVVAVGSELNIHTDAVIIDILPDGIASKDKRLQIFDQITEINGNKINQDCSEKQLQKYLKDLQPKMRLTIFRSDVESTEKVEFDLMKKPGKQFGIGLRIHHPKGMILTEVLPGGIIELDGRLRKGDIITHINSESVCNLSHEDSSILLKTIQGKATFKVLRPIPKKR